MEHICDPRSAPKMRQSKVRTHSETLTIGNSTYKLTYSSKIGISVGRSHASKLSRVGRWLQDFASSEGFVLQKFNNSSGKQDADAQPWKPTTMGASAPAANAPTQFIALTRKMAAALFSRDYVGPLTKFLNEEMIPAAHGDSIEDGEVAELYAHKEAIRIPPPAFSARTRTPMGTLVVGTTFSNYNVVRSLFSEEEPQFGDVEGGKPQIISQIVMTDSNAKENAPPMIRFSTTASDMLAILNHEPFREMVGYFLRHEDSDLTQFTISTQNSVASGGEAAKQQPEPVPEPVKRPAAEDATDEVDAPPPARRRRDTAVPVREKAPPKKRAVVLAESDDSEAEAPAEPHVPSEEEEEDSD